MPALFIVNPAARGGRGARAENAIREALGARGSNSEIAVTDGTGRAEALASEGTRRGLAPIVAVGGDGTVHEVVNGLLASRRDGAELDRETDAPAPALGVLPTGSGNDFARTFGLTADIGSAVDRILDGPRVTIDAGLSGNRVFVNAASVGFDAEVAGIVARAGGLLRSSGPLLYPLAVLRALPRFRVVPLRIDLDGRSLERRALLVAVANGPFYGGGFKICPAADPTDGWLDVCVVGDVSVAGAVRLLPRLRAGAHVGASHVEHYRAREVRIDATSAPTQLDGEPTGPAPAAFQLLPGVLRLCGAQPEAGSTTDRDTDSDRDRDIR